MNTAAPETVGLEFEAGNAKSATVRAARDANKRRPTKRSFSSWVLVVERVDAGTSSKPAPRPESETVGTGASTDPRSNPIQVDSRR